jgi:hypothetical protein
MTKNRDLGIITIDSEEDYRKHLIQQEIERESKNIERPEDDITWAVMQDLAARAKKGFIKYKTTLGKNKHQNMLQHGYEEALDLAQYLKTEITTLNTIQDMVKQYPNDAELGSKIREIYGQK